MIFPRISQEYKATESLYEDEGVRMLMKRHNEVKKKYREQEFEKKLEKASSLR